MKLQLSIIERLTRMFLEIIIKKSEEEEKEFREKDGGAVFAQAFEVMIKNYKTSIMFLDAQIKSQTKCKEDSLIINR